MIKLPNNLFVLEMANNHMGDLNHGIELIRAFGIVCRKYPQFKFAFKLQYRDLDSFIHPDLKDYFRYNETYNILKNKYRRKRQVWENLSIRYNNKICELVNNPDMRYELIKFIEYHDFNNCVIKLLKSNWKLKPFSFEDITNNKNNKHSIFYWVTHWKDTMLAFIKTIKPKFNYKFPTNIFPSTIIMLIKPMLAYWFKSNPNMNLYLLKFTFKLCPHNKPVLQYKNICNEWTSCVRTIYNNVPCCMQF